MVENQHYADKRIRMLNEQLIPRGISDKLVLGAMSRVRRELFVPDEFKDSAYDDAPMPIGYGQTISQPFIIALMTQALKLKGREKVLEIGTGSGYQAAVIADIGCRVYSVERIAPLAEKAEKLLKKEGYSVRIKIDDGTQGWEAEKPFDRIIVTAGGPNIPQPLIAQLNEGGRLVMPVGSSFSQELLLLTKTDSGTTTKNLGGCRFVKLIGKNGWQVEKTDDSGIH